MKGEQHLSSFQNNLICIGIDGKVDQRTLFYEHGIENNNQFLTRVCKPQHHLTATSESGQMKGKYLNHKNLPLSGATGAVLAEATHSL